MQTQDYQELTEGLAKITFLGSSKAFYNPVQEFNRDLTVTVLRQFVSDRLEEAKNLKELSNGNGEEEPASKRKRVELKVFKKDEPIRILDALSASGLRALRFAKEVPNVGYICANDFSDNAVASINRNVKVNGVENIVTSNFGDAVEVMMAHRGIDKRFHAVDLDPYGSPSLFLDSAVQAVSDEGLLMITCTDMASLCGNTPEACYNKYNAIPLKHKCCHEGALRILLRCIDSHANRYGRYIEPLLSVSIDFYIRVFVKIHTGQIHAKDSVTKLGHVLHCTGCQSLSTQPIVKKTVDGNSRKFTPSVFKPDIFEGNNGKCRHCGSSVHITGPMYLAPMHNEEFVKKLIQRLNSTPNEQKLGTHRRLLGTLSVISEELHDVPFYYELPEFFHVLKSPVLRVVDFRSAVLNAGYRCSISHANAKSIKTDAPLDFIWDIVRTHAKQCNITSLPENLPGHVILSKENSHTINFTYNSKAISKSQQEGMLRFQDNKGKNWGPKEKAKGSVNSIYAGFQAEEYMKKEREGLKE
uniref:tRNA (guanine(26)-N(2))-dimethyltransferase n=2 Tax=Acrobeloides nanus TaxID=290746 RepID=A0A914C3Q4_9BILA